MLDLAPPPVVPLALPVPAVLPLSPTVPAVVPLVSGLGCRVWGSEFWVFKKESVGFRGEELRN
jgi:hypothetical protein